MPRYGVDRRIKPGSDDILARREPFGVARVSVLGIGDDGFLDELDAVVRELRSVGDLDDDVDVHGNGRGTAERDRVAYALLIVLRDRYAPVPDDADRETQEQGVSDRRWVAALSNDGHFLERYAALINRVRRGILVGPAVGHALDGQNGRINGVDLAITGELRRPLLTLAQFLVRLLRRPDRFRSRRLPE